MSRFQRIVARNHKRQLVGSFDQKRAHNAARLREAEEAVFAFLERRWEGELAGRKIPKEQRKRIRQDPYFLELVDRHVRGEPLVMDDLDHTPITRERLDGEVENLAHVELRMDAPAALFCPDCGEETDRPGKLCTKCIEFRVTGRRG